jgi:hypothetical protein
MSDSFNNNDLVKIFSLSPEGFRHIFKEISNMYRKDRIVFATTFFAQLPSMNPKSVRIICYQLYTVGITMNNLYNKLPTFLSQLSSFPLETMLVLLKYKFPPYPNGDLFFLPSLDSGNLGYTSSVYGNSLQWLDFTLDVCLQQQINLNYINKSTGSTCLHIAVRSGDLSTVGLLLKHRVNPNTKSLQGISPLFSAIELLETDYKVYLKIIRILKQYGSMVDNVIKEQIRVSSYRDQVNRVLSSAETLRPEFSPLDTTYFSLDQIEDLTLMAELDPNIIDDANFPDSSLSFKNAIVKQRTQTLFVDNIMLEWPYYICEEYKPVICSLEPDIIADSPTQQVYPSLLKPNLTESYFLTDTPAAKSIPPTLNTFGFYSLPSGPMLPIQNPPLPSL